MSEPGGVTSALDAALARAKRSRAKYGLLTDMERVLDLPAQDLPSAEVLIRKWSERLRRHPAAPPLRDLQAQALEVLSHAGPQRGGFFPMGVGAGKTLLTELCATVLGAQRPVLIIPPAMRGQHERDRKFWSQHYDYLPPRVMTYGDLSQPSASDLLERRKPDLIIADEAHNLARNSAARTKRFLRYFREHPTTRFVGLSGTMTKRSLLDYDHLIQLALRGGSPLPLSHHTTVQWASVIDVKGEPDFNALEALWPLVTRHLGEEEAERLRGADYIPRRDAAREAYRDRLNTAPGVLSSTTPSCDASLVLSYRRPVLPAVVSRALTDLVDTWTAPDGEEVVDAMRLHALSMQMSAGFYFTWEIPPDPDWLEARRDWQRELRYALRHASRKGHDSPALVARACDRGEGPPERVGAWKAWKAIRNHALGPSSNCDEPPRKAVWLDDFLLRDAVRAAKGRRVLLWYHHQAVGEKLATMGVPAFGAGTDAPPDHLSVAACSIAVHGVGKNLQAWSENLILEPPSSGSTWEQLLGRTHRQGQEADEVRAEVFGHTWAYRQAVESAVTDSHYIQATTGAQMRLCFCSWDLT